MCTAYHKPAFIFRAGYQQRLIRKFTAMEQMMSQLNTQSAYLQNAFMGLQR